MAIMHMTKQDDFSLYQKAHNNMMANMMPPDTLTACPDSSKMYLGPISAQGNIMPTSMMLEDPI